MPARPLARRPWYGIRRNCPRFLISLALVCAAWKPALPLQRNCLCKNVRSIEVLAAGARRPAARARPAAALQPEPKAKLLATMLASTAGGSPTFRLQRSTYRLHRIEAHVSRRQRLAGTARDRMHWQRRHLAAAAAVAARSRSGAPTLLLHDPAFALHLNGGPDHPERPDRFKHCLASLQAAFPEEGEAAAVRWVSEAPRVTIDQITAVHTEEYAFVLRETLDRAVDEDRMLMFDGDTSAGPGTREAVLRGAGGVCAAVDAVCGGADAATPATANAFCLVRPPGHHAESNKAMGFCFLNNVMIGAAHAIAAHPSSIERVAIFDFDVHHGNGTAAQALARGAENGPSLSLSFVRFPRLFTVIPSLSWQISFSEGKIQRLKKVAGGALVS